MEGDRFGWSPDIGKFVERGDKYYLENGQILEKKPGSFFRIGQLTSEPVHENFADWSDEVRAHKLAVLEREVERSEREQKARLELRAKLCEQAKAKLTQEEYDAVFDAGLSAGRGYD